MSPTIAEFTQAVAEMKASPFGYTLSTIRQGVSDAVAACQVHANGPRMEHLKCEVEFWMEELRKWESVNEAAKLKDWSPA